MKKKVNVGDLVKTTVGAQQSLREFSPTGFGCVTKLYDEEADTVHVFWYDTGLTKPISRRWLKVLA